MKKIMFNDKYGLTDAVLKGSKTMTRRTVLKKYLHIYEDMSRLGQPCYPLEEWLISKAAVYKIGEVIAVAQSYKDAGFDPMREECMFFSIPTIIPEVSSQPLFGWHKVPLKYHKGWNNKMFVRADLMPHQIRITDIKTERLQDISDEDAMLEGIKKSMWMDISGKQLYGFGTNEDKWVSPRDAFAALINEISGKGTWERNPYMFAYTFELVK